MQDRIRSLDKLFGWAEIIIKDEGKETKHKVKFTLDSLIGLKDEGIDIMNGGEQARQELSDPLNLAKVFHFGLEESVREKITVRDLAKQIPLSGFDSVMEQISGAISDSMPARTENEGGSKKK